MLLVEVAALFFSAIAAGEAACDPKKTQSLLTVLNQVIEDAADAKGFGFGRQDVVKIDQKQTSVAPASLNDESVEFACPSADTYVLKAPKDKDLLSFQVKGKYSNKDTSTSTTIADGQFELTTCVRTITFEFTNGMPRIKSQSMGNKLGEDVNYCTQVFKTTGVGEPGQLLTELTKGKFLWTARGLGRAFDAKSEQAKESGLAQAISECFIDALKNVDYPALDNPPPGTLTIKCKAPSSSDQVRFETFGFTNPGAKKAVATGEASVPETSSEAATKKKTPSFIACVKEKFDTPQSITEPWAIVFSLTKFQKLLCQPLAILQGLVALDEPSSKPGKCLLEKLKSAGLPRADVSPKNAFEIQFDCSDAAKQVLRFVKVEKVASKGGWEKEFNINDIADKCAADVSEAKEKTKMSEKIKEIVRGGCSASKIWNGLKQSLYPKDSSETNGA